MIDPRRPDFRDTPVSPGRPRYGYHSREPAATPSITIVTPFCDFSPAFQEAARSVWAQSFQQWEWLIVNAGPSTPETDALLDEFRVRDPRVRVLTLPGSHTLGAIRNAGFAAARGAYVFQLDGDERLEPTALEKYLWFLESYPEYGFVQGFTVGYGPQPCLSTRGFHRQREFCRADQAGCAALIRRDVWRQAGGYDETLGDGLESWDFWLRCAALGVWGATLPEYLNWSHRRDADAAGLERNAGAQSRSFQKRFNEKHPRLGAEDFSRMPPNPWEAERPPREQPPCENPLRKDKPRVLLIVPWLTLGGADKFNLDLTAQLARRDWEITIATTRRGDHGWLPDFARLTPDIFVLHHFLRPADHPVFLRYLIASRRPDAVLISNSRAGYLLLPYLRAACPEPAYLDYCHSEQDDWNDGDCPRLALENLDLRITASQHLRRWMCEHGGDGQRIEVAYVGVDAGRWAPRPTARAGWRTKYGIAAACPVIVYAARLSAEKQPQVFGRVMLALARRGLEFAAFVAGDGPERRRLEEFLQRHQLQDRVHVLGGVALQEMPELLSAGDIAFLPSQREGIALSLYEALAAELAIVAADVGGQRELVTPECGLLLPRGDEETEVRRYAEALKGLLRDPQRRAALGRAGQARIRAHFTLDQMGGRMAELLTQAVQRKRAAPRPAVPAAAGREAAQRAVARLRVDHNADLLWHARRKPPTADTFNCGVAPLLGDDSQRQLFAQAEWEHIQNSRAWRLLRRFARLSPFRWLAALGFRSGRREAATTPDTPCARLAKLKASRYYRWVRALKRTAPYQWYARRKYGPDFQMMLDEPAAAVAAGAPPAKPSPSPSRNETALSGRPSATP